ncbi:ABC transporter permease [Candidatus Gottesmanbacteria bacterium]|nr:ABC transporter permease [Candidatus Gottesmanbacteria bacterium]
MNGEMLHFLELLWGMTEKELRARYKYTVFGFFWIVLNPLLQMLVIGFVFTFFIKEPVEHYYFFLFIGLLIWNFFSLSLAKATPSIVYERNLIKKAKFSHAVIPLSIIFSNFIHFVLAFILFLVPILFLETFSISRLPHLLFGSALLVSFTVGTSLLTSALNVRFRDINFFVQAILIIWFYATPIIYSLTMIPRDLLWLWRFNPLTSILQLFQHALLGAPEPGPAMLASNIGVIIITTALGILTFRDESKTFDDWV